MDRLTRRTLLSRALLAGSGATVVASLGAGVSPREAEAADDGRSVDPTVDPEFVAGRIVEGAAGTLVVLDPDADFRRIRLGRNGRVWREGAWTDDLRVGDCIYARGKLAQDGVLGVEIAWVRIVNLSGAFVGGTTRSLTVDLLREDLSPIPIGLAPGAVMADGQPASQTVPRLRRGTALRVIGFEGASTHEVVATLVVASVDAEPLAVEQGSITTAAGHIYYGVASWQCCGGVNGCGSECCSCSPKRCCPPPASHGSCGTCRTDRHGIAWPYLTNGCTAPCSSCCVGLDRLACGAPVTVTNMCNQQKGSYSVPVNDCGPNMRCVAATRCKGYQVVKWDLTACTFTAIGGNLSAGLIDTQAVD
jgi:hypothetical protein